MLVQRTGGKEEWERGGPEGITKGHMTDRVPCHPRKESPKHSRCLMEGLPSVKD